MKGAMLEGQLSPFYENDNDETDVLNPIISGDVIDEDKMDITRYKDNL